MTREVQITDPRSAEWGQLSDRVAVVFGGVTSVGDLRARRQVGSALLAGCDVVWFDGWEEAEYDDGRWQRVPVPSESDGLVMIVGYREAERSLAVNRMVRADRWLRTRAGGRGDGSGTDLVFDAAERGFVKVVQRPLSLSARTLRGRAGWKLLKPVVDQLAQQLETPVCISYADDHSLPSAWNAARRWTGCPAGSEFVAPAPRGPGSR